MSIPAPDKILSFVNIKLSPSQNIISVVRQGYHIKRLSNALNSIIPNFGGFRKLILNEEVGTPR